MKLWPQTMAGQLGALLFIGLLIAQVIAVVLLGINADLLNPVARNRDADRIVVAYRVVQLGTDEARPQLIKAMEAGDSHFWITPDRQLENSHYSSEERAMTHYLASTLGLAYKSQVTVRLTSPRINILEAFKANVAWATVTLDASLQLPDGSWLHSQHETLAAYQWWRLLRFSIPLSTLPALFIAIIFIYHTLRPIKSLAKAVERASFGERIPPLPAIGPKEARDLSNAFNTMQTNMSRFVEDRTRLLAAISHDFRTPITSLRIRAALVSDKEIQEGMIKTLEEMRLMVEETLTFAHDDVLKEATDEVDIVKVLEEIVDEQVRQGNDVRLTGCISAITRARRMSLKRAIQNITENAARYGTKTIINIEKLDSVLITVIDNGPGIPETDLERVFQPFTRLDPSRNNERGNVGLGLSIARSSVRAHGGDIIMKNLSTGGLKVIISIG